MSLRVSLTRLLSVQNRLLVFDSFSRNLRLASTMTAITIDPKTYPLARRDESIVDDFHGNKVCFHINPNAQVNIFAH